MSLTDKVQIKLNATIMHNAVAESRALITAVEQKMQDNNYFPELEFK